MSSKNIMYQFIKKINDDGLMTKFICSIFNYENINDSNYMFRLSDNKDEVIIDIYDNFSNARFNRYIFDFINDNEIEKYVDDFIYVTFICILNTRDSDNKLLKLAYLFKIDDNEMIDYAYSFLDLEFVRILRELRK